MSVTFRHWYLYPLLDHLSSSGPLISMLNRGLQRGAKMPMIFSVRRERLKRKALVWRMCGTFYKMHLIWPKPFIKLSAHINPLCHINLLCPISHILCRVYLADILFQSLLMKIKFFFVLLIHICNEVSSHMSQQTSVLIYFDSEVIMNRPVLLYFCKYLFHYFGSWFDWCFFYNKLFFIIKRERCVKQQNITYDMHMLSLQINLWMKCIMW